MIITKTPMRITLGGGGTDVVWYSSLFEGEWISAAINKYIYIRIKPSNNNRIFVRETNDKKIFQKPSPILIKIIKSCLKLEKINKPLDISIYSQVEAKSGLGGSGALEVGLLHALSIFAHKRYSKDILAEKAARLEIEMLHQPVGPQDQYITALGGIKCFHADKKGAVTYQDLKLAQATIRILNRNLLFFKTGIRKDTAGVLSDVRSSIDNRHSSARVIRSLDQIKLLGQKIKSLLMEGKTDEFGLALNHHWQIKRRLSEKVTNSAIDLWYEKALQAGALGGKIMGAGGGGWFVFYVNKLHSSFCNKMKSLGPIQEKVYFDWEGTVRVSRFPV